MALTVDLLGQIDGLSDEQKASIVTLSTNDEKIVLKKAVDKAVGLAHDRYDEILHNELGIDKTPGVKTHEGFSAKLQDVKKSFDPEKLTKLESQLATAQAQVKDLNKKIADGSQDAELKGQLATAKAQVAALQKDLDTSKQTSEKSSKALKMENTKLKADHQFLKIAAKLTPREGLSAEDFTELIEAKQMKIYAKYTPREKSDGEIEWLDDKGEVAINAEDKQNPFTSETLLLKEAGSLIGKPRKGGGGGGGNPDGGGDGGAPDRTGLDTSKFTSKRAATTEITRYLGEKGILSGTPEYDKESLEIYKEHKISELDSF